MKSTLLFAISAFAVALWLVFTGISRRAAEATEVQETNQRFPSDISLSKQRPLVSDLGTEASHPRKTPPGNPNSDDRIPRLSKNSDRRSTSHGHAPAGSPAADEVNPSAGFSATRSTIQSSPQHFSEDPYQTPQPAASVDMGDFVTLDPRRDADLQKEAERLVSILSAEAPGASVQSDAAIRHETVAASDHWFRQRYGSWLWMQHHIQAHHLAASARAAGN